MTVTAKSPARATRPTLRTGLLLGAFLAPSALGLSAAPIALPAMGADLHVSAGATAWGLAAYALTMSMSTALAGRLADLHGPRVPLVWGMALLAAGTILIVAGPSFGWVIAGRLLLGAGAGTAGVLAFAITGTLYPDSGERGAALGTMGAVVGIVSGAGPLLGGGLTDTLGWRAALALPVLSVAAAAGVAHLVPRGGAGEGRLDVRGALLCLLLAAALATILQTRALWPVTAALAAFAAVAVIAHVRYHPNGFLPRGLVTQRSFALAAAAGFTLFAAYLITQFAAPRLIAAHYDLNATQIGLVLLPTGAMSATLSNLAGRLAGRLPPARIIVACATASAAGLLVAAAAGQSAVPLVIAVGLTVSAFSAGQVVLMAIIPSLADSTHRGIASGVFQFVFLTGGSLGSAVIGGLSGALSLRAAVAVRHSYPSRESCARPASTAENHKIFGIDASDPGMNGMNTADGYGRCA